MLRVAIVACRCSLHAVHAARCTLHGARVANAWKNPRIRIPFPAFCRFRSLLRWIARVVNDCVTTYYFLRFVVRVETDRRIMVYGKEHKAVLQAIIHEGALPADNGKDVIIRLFDHDNTAKVLSEINAQLRPLYMTVKCTTCEVTGQLYWVFASTVLDKSASFHPEFSQAELALLRSVYSEIVTSSNGYVSSTFCLNLCSSLNLRLSKADADEFLREMVARKWLYSKDGKYYMGVRSIAELLQYFKDTYENNLQICTLCKQELFYSEKCSACDAATHVYCLENYARTHGGPAGCPTCRHPIPGTSSGTDAKDVDGAPQVETDIEMTQSSHAKRSKRRHKN